MAINERLLYTSIGACLKAQRQALRFTQQHLAERLGVERTSVANIESGMQRPPVHLLYRYCDIFQMEIGDLLPALRDVVQDDAREEVTVDGHSAVMPPMAASLARMLLKQLPEES